MELRETQSEVIANDALAACNQATRFVGATPVLVLPEGFKARTWKPCWSRPLVSAATLC